MSVIVLARPAAWEDVQLHWWAMYVSFEDRRSPDLKRRFGGEGGGSVDGFFGSGVVSELGCLFDMASPSMSICR